MESESGSTETREERKSNWRSWVMIALLVYALLVAVNVISDGFQLATMAAGAEQLFEFASNPIIALIIGIVATAAVQSSSTVTSVIVGMVAGGLPMSIAIPMIMGANVGTSLTSTLVSLGHIRDDDEFARAFSAATVHDNFNILAVAILFPLELLFSPLERISYVVAGWLPTGSADGMGDFGFLGFLVGPLVDAIGAVGALMPEIWDGVLLIVIGVAMIIGVVTALSKLLKKVMVGRALRIMETAVGRGPVSGVGAGATITVMVQSSTTTTCLIVPMAGSGVFSLRQVYPFTLGCNIGTTITALVAALGVTGANAPLALQIALVHLFFSLLAIAIIVSIPVLRTLPMVMSRTLARYARRNKLYVFAYIGCVFFLMPLIVLGCTRLLF